MNEMRYGGKGAAKRVSCDPQLEVFVFLVVEVLDSFVHPTMRLLHRVNALVESLNVSSDRSK